MKKLTMTDTYVVKRDILTDNAVLVEENPTFRRELIHRASQRVTKSLINEAIAAHPNLYFAQWKVTATVPMVVGMIRVFVEPIAPQD